MNPLWTIFWLLVLILLSFVVAGFCAFWYILLYPLTVCIPACADFTNILLKGVQFPHMCAQGMVDGRAMF